jgi:Eukaryotic glutathione synthase, ATP binding domain
MMHESRDNEIEIKQVEMNAIAISFGSLAPVVRKIHRQMLASSIIVVVIR